MTAWLIRVGIAILCRLVPLLIGIRFWKRYQIGEKALIVLFGYDIIGIIVGAFLAYYYRNNLIVGNIYDMVEVLVLAIYFKSYAQNSSAKKIINWFPLLYALMHIVTSVYEFGIHNNNPAGNAVRGVFIIVMSSIAIGHIILEDNRIYNNGRFWIVAALLCFHLINTGYLTMSYWLIKYDSSLTWDFHMILTFSFYVLSVSFAMGLLMIAKERKSQKRIVVK